MSDMKQLWDKFEADLKAKCHKIDDYFEKVAIFNKGASEEEIKLFEKQLGKKLPNDYKESLKIHNGYTSRGYQVAIYQWSLYSCSKILKDKKYWDNYNKFEIEPGEDVEWNKNWIAIGDDNGGLTIAIDTKTNKIVCFDPAEDPSLEGEPILANSFTDFLKQEFSNCLDQFNKSDEVVKLKKKSFLDKIFGR